MMTLQTVRCHGPRGPHPAFQVNFPRVTNSIGLNCIAAGAVGLVAGNMHAYGVHGNAGWLAPFSIYLLPNAFQP